MDTRLNFQEKSQKIIKFQKRIEIIQGVPKKTLFNEIGTQAAP